MESNYIDIDGKYYALDVEKMMKFISEDDSASQSISQTYGIPLGEPNPQMANIKLISKEVAETKEGINENMSNIRYSLLTTILNLVVIPTTDGNGNFIITQDLKNLHLGQIIAFNTLLEMGIIFEINENE